MNGRATERHSHHRELGDIEGWPLANFDRAVQKAVAWAAFEFRLFSRIPAVGVYSTEQYNFRNYRPPEPEMRHFVAHRHRTVEDVFGEQTDIFGPDFYVDNRHDSLFVTVSDNVADAAWLEVPLGVFAEYTTRLPFASRSDFARANMPFLHRFVEEANNTVLSEGRGLYVCAADTYEVRNGQGTISGRASDQRDRTAGEHA